MKDKNRTKRFRFKVGLRGQQVVLFLLVALMPLFAISLAIKVLGENALKGTVGENHVLLAQEKLARADSAISEKIAKIEAELPNIRPAVVYSNTANGEEAVFFDVWTQLVDSIRLLETYAGAKTEVTITNASGHVLRSNNQELEYYTKRGVPRQVNDTTWWQRTYNHGVGYPFAEDIRYDTARRVHLLPIALPIRTVPKTSAVSDEKNTVGVLRIVLVLPELKNIIESSSELEETHTILTNESGKVIAASSGSGYRVDSHIEMNNAAEEAIIEAKRGSKENTTIMKRKVKKIFSTNRGYMVGLEPNSHLQSRGRFDKTSVIGLFLFPDLPPSLMPVL